MAKIKWEQRCVHKERRDFWWRQTSGQFLQRNQCNFHHESKNSSSSLQKKRRNHKVEKNWERSKKPWGRIRVGECLVNRAKNIFDESALVHPVKNWFLQSVWHTKQNQDAISEKRALSHIERLKNGSSKKSQDKSDKSAVTFLKETNNLGCVSHEDAMRDAEVRDQIHSQQNLPKRMSGLAKKRGNWQGKFSNWIREH